MYYCGKLNECTLRWRMIPVKDRFHPALTQASTLSYLHRQISTGVNACETRYRASLPNTQFRRDWKTRGKAEARSRRKISSTCICFASLGKQALIDDTERGPEIRALMHHSSSVAVVGARARQNTSPTSKALSCRAHFTSRRPLRSHVNGAPSPPIHFTSPSKPGSLSLTQHSARPIAS